MDKTRFPRESPDAPESSRRRGSAGNWDEMNAEAGVLGTDEDVSTLTMQLIGGVWRDVAAEWRRSHELHPHVHADRLRSTCVMVEEAGEALKEAMDLTRMEMGQGTEGMSRELEVMLNLYKETLECVTSGLRNLNVMKREIKEMTDAIR